MMMHSYGWNHMSGLGWFGTMFMSIVWLVVLLAIIYFVVRLLSSSRSTDSVTGGNQDPAIEILRERYARGEISAEEYRQARTMLDRADHGPIPES